jgi:hypothetical protein
VGAADQEREDLGLMATLAVYRRSLAPLCGVFEKGTADAGANSLTQLVCTTSLDSGASLKDASFPASLFNGKWLYMPGAAADDKSRLIRADGGYDPSNGYLIPGRAWGADPDTLTDRTFEITSLFSGTDLNTLVNEGLKKCFVVVEFTFSVASTSTTRHNLTTTSAWLTKPQWVYQIGKLSSSQSRTEVNPFDYVYRGKAPQGDGSAVYLEGVSFSTTDTIYVKAIKPAYYHCRANGGTFGEQTGLSLETDECSVDAEWVAWAAIVAGQKRLAHLERQGQATQESMAARAIASAEFLKYARLNFTPPRRTFISPAHMAPVAGGSW